MSEAIGYGIPTVISDFSAGSSRISEESGISCIGKDVQSFKKCVIDVYNDETKWDKIQKNGFNFIQQTQNRKLHQRKWSKLIKKGKKMHNKRKHKRTRKLCDEGEELYKRKYPEIAKLIENGMFRTAYGHWRYIGKYEGRSYTCASEDHPLFKIDLIDPQACPEGEAIYLKLYADVREKVKKGVYSTGHEHWVSSGAKEGRSYFCK